ncbi:hypothetical protein [Marinobacter oulmenensis]|uniref:Uncharacterized protein n=1 Tax=Marinobacter oulmenensis TaxID=643747 RepID=A0A840UBC4_9GAMM|nr:hypothetical protein [Marinobacter oulmenensis]MBB5319971.1 hypothetical protein [Marinobacter oulmenensis]
MNPSLLDIARHGTPDCLLRQLQPEPDGARTPDDTRAAFVMLTEEGEIAGYVRTWQEADGYTGYVQFDEQGNIQNWKVLQDGFQSLR